MPGRALARPPAADWERQPGEPALLYGYFARYRDAGPQRSISKLRAELAADGEPRTMRTLERHSTKWRWVERSDAYMDYWERRLRQERETERLRIERTTAAIGAQFTTAAMLRMQGREPAVDGRGRPVEPIDALSPSEMDWRDVVAVGRLGIELQRLAVGLATSLQGVTKITPAELVQTIRDLVEGMLVFVPDEMQPRAMAWVEGYFEAGRRAI